MSHRGNRRRVSAQHMEFDPALIKRLVPAAQTLSLRDDTENSRMLIHAVRMAWHAALTPVQRTYIQEYYINRKTMQHIAEEYGVSRGTVSRTLRRARDRLHNALQYCF